MVEHDGGNANAVASHVLAMVLMLSKQIIQTNHARKGSIKDRNAFTGRDSWPHHRHVRISAIAWHRGFARACST